MSRKIKIIEKAFHLLENEKKFILLGSEKNENKDFIKSYILRKLKREITYNDKEFWGTLGFADDKPVNWSGDLEISADGNENITDQSVLTEIGFIKQMFPEASKNKIIERFISFKDIVFKFPDEFTINQIPELRLTLMLEKTQGALVFYSHADEDEPEKNVIEYILPEATPDNETSHRDRLNYKFRVLPDFKYEEVPGKENVFKLSSDAILEPFIVKILTFERGQFKNSRETIRQAKATIFENLGFHKEHQILVYNKDKNDFVNAKKLNINSKLKTLFLIHGTFGTTESSFDDLYKKTNWLNNLLDDKIYEQIIAFEHPTLFFGAADNIDVMHNEFDELNIKQFEHEVDFIGTSQGGLLVQYLANQQQNRINVGKAVLVSSANGVDYLTSAEYVPKFLTFIKYLTKSTGNFKAALVCAVAQHSAEFLLKQPGFLVMKPGSTELQDIIYNQPIGNTCYLPVIDDYDQTVLPPDARIVKRWIAKGVDIFARLNMGKFNDWVVATEKQFKVPEKYCAIKNYNPVDFEPYIIKSIHGQCLAKPIAQKMIDDFLSNHDKTSCCKNYEASKFTLLLNKSFPQPKEIRWDGHCHILSREILSKRMMLMFVESIQDFDFFRSNDKKKNADKKGIDLFELLKYLLLNKDSKDTYSEIRDIYLKTDSSVQKFVPLMMDIEYCFVSRYNQILGIEDDDANKTKTKKNLIEILKQFNIGRDRIISLIKNSRDKFDKEKLNILQNFIEFTEGKVDYNDESVLSEYTDNLATGYEKQIKDMIDLKEIHREKFQPFLATDPRRPGMMNLIKENVGKGKTFTGVKLYPPVGYSPTDSFLFGINEGDDCVYKYCIDNNIPIITHCSSGGFSTFVKHLDVLGMVMPTMNDKDLPIDYKTITEIEFVNNNILKFGEIVAERAFRLNHPKLWAKVLERYPTLKINFAHFGGDEGILSDNRRDGIFDLMKMYTNVYTDISCIIEKSVLDKIYKNYFINNPKMQEKFIYGSDFFLNMLWHKTFDDYYKDFTNTFSSEDFKLITITNPEKFLGV